MIKENYVDNFLQGERVTYHENGNVKILAHYDNGIIHGKYYQFTEDGKQIYMVEFDHGKKIEKNA